MSPANHQETENTDSHMSGLTKLSINDNKSSLTTSTITAQRNTESPVTNHQETENTNSGVSGASLNLRKLSVVSHKKM